jgi:hypothetical protein
MKEKQFEKQVKDFLKKRGCWVLKTWSNGVQRSGVPDLLVSCNGFFIGIELKAEKGVPSELQLWNIAKIRQSGGIGIVLYPDQFEQFKCMINYIKCEFDHPLGDQINQVVFDKRKISEWSEEE